MNYRVVDLLGGLDVRAKDLRGLVLPERKYQA